MRYTSAEQRYAAAELSEKIKQYPEVECRYHSVERWYPKHGILTYRNIRRGRQADLKMISSGRKVAFQSTELMISLRRNIHLQYVHCFIRCKTWTSGNWS